MRTLLVWLLVSLGVPAPAAARAAAAPAAQDDRALIAALERMAVMGEPHHNTHEAGELLQMAVDRALQQYTPEVERAAIRAAAQIAATVTNPVVTPDGRPVKLSARLALSLPRPVTFTARIFGSFDGGPLVFLGHAQPGTVLWLEAPAPARLPGWHHVRLRAFIVYDGPPGAPLPAPEYRDHAELSYAIFDPELPTEFDAQLFRFSPALVSASQFDNALPDVPFWFWLNTLLVEHGSDPLHALQWTNFFCDERTKEPAAAHRRLDICAVITFDVASVLGEIWIRTGRIDYSKPTAVQWFVTPPALAAVRFIRPEPTEIVDLSRLDDLLAMDPAKWPAPDITVRPEDILISPVTGQPNAFHVRAAIRNVGNTDARGVYVEMLGVDPYAPATSRHFVTDVRAGGSVVLEITVACPGGYGIAFVTAHTPLSDYSPVLSEQDDPTPKNNLAFRLINPQRAPKSLVADLQSSSFCDHVGGCRGY